MEIIALAEKFATGNLAGRLKFAEAAEALGFDKAATAKLLGHLERNETNRQAGRRYCEHKRGDGFVWDGKLDDYEQEQLDQAKERQMRYRLQQCGIPADFVCANFDFDEVGQPLDIGEHNARAVQVCQSFSEKWSRTWKPKFTGIVLASGGKGIGKTYLAYATVVRLMRTNRAKCLAITTGGLLDRYRESFRNGEGQGMSAHQIFEMYANCDVLFLDDLGAEPIKSGEAGDWARGEFFKLMDHRYTNKLSTIATTNSTPRQLEEHYEGRTVSRLLGGSMYLEFDGPDYRQRRPAGAKEEYDPFFE